MAIPDYLENTVKDYANQAAAAYSAPINTSTFTGSQFVAGEDPLQTQAINMAQQGVGSYQPYLTAAHQLGNMGIGQLGQAQNTLRGVGGTINQAGSALGQAGAAYGGMGGYQAAGGAAAQNAANIAGGASGMTGPNAYKQFMSPYQQQVIDATLAEYDKQGAAGAQSIKDQAVNSGNFGGGREGAQLGEYQANRLADRAALQGSMLEKGFGQANKLAQQNFANQGALFGMQQGLGGMASNLFNQQGQMGAAQQSLANAQLNRGQAMQGLSASQRGISDAYGDQINRQFNMGNFARQGMGQDISALGSMGAIRQGMNQAQLSADQQAARTGAYEPYGRLTQFGNVLTGLGGGYAGQQYQDPGSGGSPFQSALGTATGLAGLYGNIFGK
jgi:predicted small secreted protein